MHKTVIDPARSRLMQRVRSKNTGPERFVRSLLHRLGYRFRVHARYLPGTPDIVFPKRKKVCLVHGCYWHGHGCKKGRPPKSRLEFWGPKIEANRARDLRNEEALNAMGWSVLVLWQCELRDEKALQAILKKFLGSVKAPLPPPRSNLTRWTSGLVPRVSD